jgi:hypothetical protein
MLAVIAAVLLAIAFIINAAAVARAPFFRRSASCWPDSPVSLCTRPESARGSPPPVGGADVLAASAGEPAASRKWPVAAGFGSPEAGSRGLHGALSGLAAP